MEASPDGLLRFLDYSALAYLRCNRSTCSMSMRLIIPYLELKDQGSINSEYKNVINQ